MLELVRKVKQERNQKQKFAAAAAQLLQVNRKKQVTVQKRMENFLGEHPGSGELRHTPQSQLLKTPKTLQLMQLQNWE